MKSEAWVLLICLFGFWGVVITSYINYSIFHAIISAIVTSAILIIVGYLYFRLQKE